MSLQPIVALVASFAIIAAGGASPLSGQSWDSALSLSVEPLGVWCDADSSVLITVLNGGSEPRWIGLHELEDEMVPMVTTSVMYRVDLGDGRSLMRITDGLSPMPPARGLVIRSGDSDTFAGGFILEWDRANVPFTFLERVRPGARFTAEPPFTVRVDWEFFGYESATGSSGTWEPTESEVSTYFQVEPIEGTDCVVAQLEE
jgi:hypothetical protein